MTDHRRPSFEDDNTIVESVAPQEPKRMSAFKKGIILAITGAIVAGSLSTIAFPQGAVTLVNIILGGGGGVVSSSNPLPISGSFSATLSGFPGTTQTTGTPIAVTTGGVTGTLPAGTVVVASNVGATNGAYCKLGASATTSDQLIPPNSWFGFTVGSNTQLTCITSTSTTTVNMVGGAGLPTGSGGGGGGGGGGGTVTQGPTGTNAAAWWAQIGDTTNGPVAVGTVGADAVSNTQNGLATYSRLELYNGTTWDRWRGVSGAANIAGTGTSGTPAGGVLTIQGAASMTKLLVTPDSVALPANQSVNVSQVNGVTTLTGTGAVGTGSQRIAVGTDTATIAGSAPGTAGTASANVLTVQGIASMTPLLSNPGTAANWGVGATGSAVPANAVYGGVNIAGNLVGSTGLALGATTKAPTVAIVDASGNQITAFGGSGGTASNFGSAFPSAGTAVGFTDGTNMVAGKVIASGADATSNTNTELLTGSFNYGFNGTTWDRLRTGTTLGSMLINGAGTAGTASGGVLTVQGVASMTPVQVSQATAANLNATVTLNPGTSTAMQTAAVANGNGTNLTVTGFNTALVNVNCSVACSGGTTINFEGTDSTGTFFSVAAIPVAGTSTAVSTAVTSGQFWVPVAGLTSLRARISAYSAGTITVTGTPMYGADSIIAQVANSNPNGQAVMASSSPVVIASNQSAVPVTLTSTTITGTVAAVGPTAVGSANANPPVVIGGTATGAAGANVQGLSIVATSVAPVTATNTALVVDLRPDSPGIIALGPAADTSAVPVVATPTGNSNSGITPVVGGSAVSSLVLKGSAGNLYAVYANCTSACWLMVFNATAAPANGATTAGVASGNMVECIPIGAGSVGGVNYAPGPPAVYSVGITAAISSTACSTLTLSTVAMIHGMVK